MRKVLFCLLALAASARADLGPPMTVDLFRSDGSEVPAPGTIMEFTLRMESSEAIGVSNVDVLSSRDGQGIRAWPVVSTNVPVEFALEPDTPREFSIQLIAERPEEDFGITWFAGGRTWNRAFRVAPLPPATFETVPDGVPVFGAPRASSVPARGEDPAIDLTWIPPIDETPPAPRVGSHEDAFDDEPVLDRAGLSPTIRITGQFVYDGDGIFMNAVDGAMVRVYDYQSGPDFLLGTGITGPDGTFDFQVSRGGFDPLPDVYLVFQAQNGYIKVISPIVAVLEDATGTTVPYEFKTNIRSNVAVAQLDYGTRRLSTVTLAPAFHQLTVLTRTWRYLEGLGEASGFGPVTVRWPNGDEDGAYYTSSDSRIHLSDAELWAESTIAHEFGHHWVTNLASSPSPQYCDSPGYGDVPGDCGHRLWCPENANVAWTEGFPDFMSQAITDHISEWYDTVEVAYDFEELRECSETGTFVDPPNTEGFFAAMAYDVADDVYDDDDFTPGIPDLFGVGVKPLLQAARGNTNPTPQGFLDRYLAVHPQHVSYELWSSIANNGFDIDDTPPGFPTGVFSPTHTVGVESGNDRITVQWNPSSDDLSGVSHYRIRVATVPISPFVGTSSVDVTGTEFTTASLDEDESWYVNLAAVDNAGNGSAFVTLGPFELRDPIPADFSMQAPRGWYAPVVPRRTDDATGGAALLPNLLSGDQPITWFNYQIQNLGELPNPSTVNNRLWIDGELRFDSNITAANPLDPGAAIAFINLGPTTVRGGRHMVSFKTDATGAILEPDEANNTFHQQFVWYPTLLATDQVVGRAAPPKSFGGFESVVPFSSPNCDGLAYVFGAEPFVGVAVVPGNFLGSVGDVDLRAHPNTTGPTNGFSTSSILASSSRPVGATDVLLSNTAATGNLVDVGVRSSDAIPFGYTIQRITSSSIPSGSQQTFPMGDDVYAELRHVILPGGGGTNYGTVRVSVEPANEIVHVAVVPPGTGHFGWDGATIVGATNRSGEVALDFTYTSSLHGIVLLRDREADGEAPDPVTVTLWAGPTPADLRPAVASQGWAAPVVPTTGAPGGANAVPLPTSLLGNQATTYVNAAIRNDGPNTAAPLEFNVLVDDAFVGGAQVAQIGGLGLHRYNAANAITVRGGRHTMWAWADANDLIEESDEFDNLWGRQWVWTPASLIDGSPRTEPAPSDPFGGIEAVVEARATSFHLNSVGFRTAVPSGGSDDGYWQAVAVAPGDTSDVDVRLHEVVSGVDAGFAVSLAGSGWPKGETDYVLTNFRNTGRRAMDVGVVKVGGDQDFRIQQVSSVFAGVDPSGSTGDVVLGAGSMMALYEVELSVGLRTIDLVAVDGAVDWGITLHPANLSYHARTVGDLAPTAWEAPAGVGESLVLDVPQSGRYCLAVWKASTSDVDLAGTYRIEWEGSATSAPDLARALRFGLHGVAPNPFNPRTTVAFEIEGDGPAHLSVFDLRGALVRRLHRGELPAGRHEIVWDGLDDRGRSVASGVYFVRLEFDGRRDTRKAVLVK